MGQRAYRRDSRGRFAGGGGGTTVTHGRAGGFANAQFRARAGAGRASPKKTLNLGQRALKSKTVRTAAFAGAGTLAARAAFNSNERMVVRKIFSNNKGLPVSSLLRPRANRQGIFNISSLN